MSLKVLGINGSTGKESKTKKLLEIALGEAASHGATTHLINLGEEDLPIMTLGNPSPPPQLKAIRNQVEAAEAYLLGTPEYHGCMSGALKNFLDYFYTEFAGKLFGIIVNCGGGNGVSAAYNIRTACQYCHGWVLPYQVAAVSKDFSETNELVNDSVRDRLIRLGKDIVTYGACLYGTFKEELGKPRHQAGFAAWHILKL